VTLDIRNVTPFVYRCPLDEPVTTSFGTMRDRPMVLVRVEDREGAVGWGEIWCNFPAVGAEHRARLVDSVLAPLSCEKTFASAQEAFEHLTRRTAVLAIQSGEAGPIAQAIAGLDIALWDLEARRAGQPLWKFLNPGAAPNIQVYASGLNPTNPEGLALARQKEGHIAFKLKIGFGIERDVRNLQALRTSLGPAALLMVDANQAWDVSTALDVLPRLEPFQLQWLEEPLRADEPWSEWAKLRERTSVPLAAGENIMGLEAFDLALKSGVLSVVQPDIAKWGGFSGCFPVAKRIIAAGRTYCPHYLGGGVGLLASAHLLAAAGGDGRLEIDSNPNPLRTLLSGPVQTICDGKVTLPDRPGLGIEPDAVHLKEYAVSWR